MRRAAFTGISTGAVVVVVVVALVSCPAPGVGVCNSDNDCLRSQLCVLGECTAAAGGEGEGQGGEGEGQGGEGEGQGGEGEGQGGEGEGEGEGQPPICGDRVVDAGEECDDGVVGDAFCTSACRLPCESGAGAASAFVDASGACIVAFDVAKTWIDALVDCRRRGGNLVRIGDAAQDARVAQLVLGFSGGVGAWIGLHDLVTEGTFAWSDDGTAQFLAFGVGEPNDAGGGEDCVTVRSPTADWNDLACETARPYVCALPPPSSCGDAIVDANEGCDDGNAVDGDGCTVCAVDPGFSCFGPFCGPTTKVVNVPADLPTLDVALGLAVSGQTIVLAPGTYGSSNNDIRTDVTIVAPGGAIVAANGGNEALRVRAADVKIWNLVLTAASADVILVDVDALLTVDSCDISGAHGFGVRYRNAGAARLTLRRSTVHDNDQGGVRLEGGSFVVVNNVIVRNGGTGLNPAVELKLAPAPGSVFAHNTVVANQAAGGVVSGIDCNVPALVLDSIVWDNVLPAVQVSANCSVVESDVQGGAAGFGNIDADPLFVNEAAEDLHLLTGSPCADAAPLSNELSDVDSARRAGARDIGADER